MFLVLLFLHLFFSIDEVSTKFFIPYQTRKVVYPFFSLIDWRVFSDSQSFCEKNGLSSANSIYYEINVFYQTISFLLNEQFSKQNIDCCYCSKTFNCRSEWSINNRLQWFISLRWNNKGLCFLIFSPSFLGILFKASRKLQLQLRYIKIFYFCFYHLQYIHAYGILSVHPIFFWKNPLYC